VRAGDFLDLDARRDATPHQQWIGFAQMSLGRAEE
jgi:hypothetical protein